MSLCVYRYSASTRHHLGDFVFRLSVHSSVCDSFPYVHKTETNIFVCIRGLNHVQVFACDDQAAHWRFNLFLNKSNTIISVLKFMLNNMQHISPLVKSLCRFPYKEHIDNNAQGSLSCFCCCSMVDVYVFHTCHGYFTCIGTVLPLPQRPCALLSVDII